MLIAWKETEPLDVHNVTVFLADNKYVTAVMRDGSEKLLSESLTKIHALYPAMIRVSRRALVNRRHILGLYQIGRGVLNDMEYHVLLTGGTAVPVSRRQRNVRKGESALAILLRAGFRVTLPPKEVSGV